MTAVDVDTAVRTPGGSPVLTVRGAKKRFGAVTALDGVDLDIWPGQVLALLGDNGAGKSTLIKCLNGVHRLDAGTIWMDGTEVSIHAPADARALGIETVYQDLALFDNLRPTDNFYAGRELAGPSWLPRSVRVLKRRQMAESHARGPRAAPGRAARFQRHRRAHVGWAAAGSRRQSGRGVRIEGRDSRRANGCAGCPRVAQSTRLDPAAAEREQGRRRRLARDGSRDGGRRSRCRLASRSRGR